MFYILFYIVFIFIYIPCEWISLCISLCTLLECFFLFLFSSTNWKNKSMSWGDFNLLRVHCTMMSVCMHFFCDCISLIFARFLRFSINRNFRLLFLYFWLCIFFVFGFFFNFNYIYIFNICFINIYFEL